jgi:hypothetical protein
MRDIRFVRLMHVSALTSKTRRVGGRSEHMILGSKGFGRAVERTHMKVSSKLCVLGK